MQAAADAEAEWETLMNTHEFDTALASPVLSEDPRAAASAVSGGRVRKDHWKGMTATEKKAIFDEQFHQARSPYSAVALSNSFCPQCHAVNCGAQLVGSANTSIGAQQRTQVEPSDRIFQATEQETHDAWLSLRLQEANACRHDRRWRS